MSAMPYLSRWFGGYPLHIFLVLLKCSKLSSLCVMLLLQVLDPNHEMPCGRKNVLPSKLVVAVDLALWP